MEKAANFLNGVPATTLLAAVVVVFAWLRRWGGKGKNSEFNERWSDSKVAERRVFP